jgi:hypothetical protein
VTGFGQLGAIKVLPLDFGSGVHLQSDIGIDIGISQRSTLTLTSALALALALTLTLMFIFMLMLMLAVRRVCFAPPRFRSFCRLGSVSREE